MGKWICLAAVRLMRAIFTVDGPVRTARLVSACDNEFIYINGHTARPRRTARWDTASGRPGGSVSGVRAAARIRAKWGVSRYATPRALSAWRGPRGRRLREFDTEGAPPA